MLTYIFAAIFLLVASTCAVMRKTYAIAPPHELKRQAASGNELAVNLYRAVGFGVSLQVLLWIGVIIGSAVGFVLLATSVSALLSILLIAALVWFNFLWLPKARVSGISVRITKILTPIIVWKLHYLDKPLRILANFANRYKRPEHSGLYELQDLLNLLDLQSQQPDSRITSEEIQLIRQVIDFNDRLVRDVLRPRIHVKAVSLGDAIGPVLLDELHASGQTSFPVKKSTRSQEIVGVLHLGDIGIHSTGSVQDYASQGAQQVRDSNTLAATLHCFYQTRQQLFVVADSEDEYVGIITLADILSSLIIAEPQPTEIESEAS